MPKKKMVTMSREIFSKEAQKYAIEALTSLLELGRTAEKETTRLYAWKAILERGFGSTTHLEDSNAPLQPPTLMIIPYHSKHALTRDDEENRN